MFVLKILWHVILIIFSCIILGFSYEANTYDYEAQFEYQDDLNWNNNIFEFRLWLKLMSNPERSITCEFEENHKFDEHIDIKKSFTLMKPLMGPYPCKNGTSSVRYIGKLNEENNPIGHGKVLVLDNNKTIEQIICYDLRPDIERIDGNFENGILNGPAIIEYKSLDNMQVTFSNGTIEGIVRRFDKAGNFEMIGNYYHGVPDGPFWMRNTYKTTFTFIHFDMGQIIPNNVALVDISTNSGSIGELVNGSYLQHAQDMQVNWYADYKCLKVIALPSKDHSKPMNNATIKLPIYIESTLNDQNVLIHPSDFLYFNRVAKTGSTAFTKLIQILGKKLLFEGINAFDSIIYDTYQGQLEEINSILSIKQPTVWIRYYAFLDFKSFGYKWKPEWISIVRNPIERVSYNKRICF